ncbi:X-ray repair cross complementing protein 3, xrcc3, putative [Ricinus communis]|uniref:X-ray repair cross complementing protein 3, xrcc3, putative n=1 Tax=Ricinus communis TaxID=3988 RepID=B9T088_RICCO|nr:X-ray repair cross complementing protein 3, xrcc3, putative [Ricinus communis]|eukprot:XP_002531657.1 DNA repair protein XRCC3 homolog [Ricinus communis]
MKPENLVFQPIPTQKCTLGCPILDRCLNGGIPCNSITEIVAESGTGKTQLCLQLSLYAQLPLSLGGLSASSLYLHTEFPFPFRRLHQLSHSFQSQHPQIFINNNNNDTINNYDNPCDNIFVHSVRSADYLFDIMPKIESFLVYSKTHLPVRLIVIDSVAALFRSEFENTATDLKRRSALFFKISAKLRALAWRFNLAVVVSNQVVDFVGSGDGLNGARIGDLGSLYSSGRRVCPALGLAWANCVNSRLFLSRDENGMVDGAESGSFCSQTRRRLHVVFAPHLPYSSCEFVIRREGVFGIDS